MRGPIANVVLTKRAAENTTGVLEDCLETSNGEHTRYMWLKTEGKNSNTFS